MTVNYRTANVSGIKITLETHCREIAEALVPFLARAIGN